MLLNHQQLTSIGNNNVPQSAKACSDILGPPLTLHGTFIVFQVSLLIMVNKLKMAILD